MTVDGRALLLGLGNTVLSDDGVGVYAARRAREALTADDAIDIVEAEVAGFALIDILDGYQRAVIIDALVRAGGQPGAIEIFDLESVPPSSHLARGHEIDLPTAVALSRQMGGDPPGDIWVVGVLVLDVYTVGECCTPQVERAIDPAARIALEVARGRNR
jgi:hydrogenase maturation protease